MHLHSAPYTSTCAGHRDLYKLPSSITSKTSCNLRMEKTLSGLVTMRRESGICGIRVGSFIEETTYYKPSVQVAATAPIDERVQLLGFPR